MHTLVRSFPVLLLVLGPVPLPDALAPVPPLALQGVVTAALRGGFWGAVLAVALRRRWRMPELVFGALFGVLVLTLVDAVLLATQGGLPALVAGDDAQAWLRAGLANAAWGWGTALMILLAPPRRG